MTIYEWISIAVVIIPIILNVISTALHATGRPRAAAIVDAISPVAVNALSRAVAKPTDRPPPPPKDPPTPGNATMSMPGLSMFGALAIALTLSSQLIGCASVIDGAVVAVNTESDALQASEGMIAGLEAHDLHDAIDASTDVASANAAKLKVAAKYHPVWVVYDHARSQFVIARLAVATYLGATAVGEHPSIANALGAVIALGNEYAPLVAAVKELEK